MKYDYNIVGNFSNLKWEHVRVVAAAHCKWTITSPNHKIVANNLKKHHSASARFLTSTVARLAYRSATPAGSYSALNMASAQTAKWLHKKVLLIQRIPSILFLVNLKQENIYLGVCSLI